MKSLNISKVLSYLFIMVGVVGMIASPVSAVKADENFKIGGPGYSCIPEEEENRWKIETGNSATLPEGYSHSDVLVKSANNCIAVYPNNEASDCYDVEMNGNTVTVTQLVDSNECQGISHLEGIFSIEEETPPPVPNDRPSMSSEVTCGSATITFNNPTRYFFSGDYRVDGEAGTNDDYTNMVIQHGPFAELTFGQRFNIVDLPANSVENRVINFAEDSGTHEVKYRIFRGAENDWYLNWETVEVESDCEENSTPTPTPTPTETPNVVSSLATIDPSCESDTVTAIHKIAEDNEPVQGVRVRFTYNGEEQTIETDADGKATARFTYTGDGYVDSYPDGFAHAANYITKETDCDSTPAIGGSVLGASTEGPQSYAETGVAEDVIMSLVGLMGAGLLTSGSITHVKAKK